MKLCLRCNTNKELNEFSKHSRRKDGLQVYCKSCIKDINAAHYKKTSHSPKRLANKQARVDKGKSYIFAYLKKNPCVDCGETDIEILQFDHKVMLRRKGSRVTDLVECSIERIQREIDLCEVRCGNCHLRRTRQQMGWSRIEGE